MKTKEQKKKEAVERNKKYEILPLDTKIQKQIDGGFDGKQLKKLRAKKETQK